MKNQEKTNEVNNLILKINQTFGIDILSKSKKYHIIWFKHYVVEKFEYKAPKLVSDALQLPPSSISRYRSKINENKERPQFIDICKVVETMSVELYQKFIIDHKVDRYIMKSDVLRKRPKNLNEVILILRKVKKHRLWDKPFDKWTAVDFRDLEKLNVKV